jgi:hypothetical protein
MKTVVVLGSLVTMLAVAVPARAELVTEPPGAEQPKAATGETPSSSSLDVDLKLGLKGFRLGGRIFGPGGYAAGAWINGETRPDGFSLDGRVERDGKAHNFKFNADIDEWVRRAVRWWSVTDL